MALRKADNEGAVREGWARDENNEVFMDGYNAIIQLTTDDGTSGFEVQNSIGATSFLTDSDGDGYFAKRLGIGTENPETALEVIGKIRSDELQVTSGVQAGYVLTSDSFGNATWQSPSMATDILLDGYVREITFQENKNAQEQINQAIIQALDGYSVSGFVEQITFQENKNSQQQINQTIIQALDGYASNITVSENLNAQQQINQSIIQAIDGYVEQITFQENKNSQQQINQTIIQTLDGYVTAKDTSSIGDGYIAFFTGLEKNIAGDNDLFFDRANNQLVVPFLKLTNTPIDGYILTSDALGNGTWQENISSPTNHRNIDQLVHNIAETSYEEYTYTSGKITNITIWTSSEKVTKIREDIITYSGALVSSMTIIQYNSYGVATETLTETYTYTGTNVNSITRVLS